MFEDVIGERVTPEGEKYVAAPFVVIGGEGKKDERVRMFWTVEA